MSQWREIGLTVELGFFYGHLFLSDCCLSYFPDAKRGKLFLFSLFVV